MRSRSRSARRALVALALAAGAALGCGEDRAPQRDESARSAPRAPSPRARARATALAAAALDALASDTPLALTLAEAAGREALVPASTAALRAALRATEERPPFREHAGTLTCATFSPDGDRVVTGSLDGTVRTWTADGDALDVLRGHVASIETTRFSPDGACVLSASADGTARIWSSEGAEIAVLRGHAAGLADARWSPTGAHVMTLSLDGDARLWDRAGAPVATLASAELGASSVAFSPSGDRVLVVSRARGAGRVVDLDGRVIATLRGPGEALESAVFSQAGARLLCAAGDGTASVIAMDGRRLATLRGHGAQILAGAFAPSGERPRDRLATASLDGTARLWTGDGEQVAVLEGHSAAVHSIAFSDGGGGGRLLTVSTDRTARLWGDDGGALATLGDGDADGAVLAASLSPDGATVLTLEDGGRAAGLWSLDGERRDTLLAAEGERFLTARFAPTGERVLTISSRRAGRTWLARPADLLARAQGGSGPALAPEEIERYARGPTPVAAPRPAAASPLAAPRGSIAARTPAGEYAGTSSCARCHRPEYELWARSTHARSTDAATTDNLPSAVVAGGVADHPPGRTSFRGTDAGYVARTMGADGKPHDYAVTHVVGQKRVRMLVTTLGDGRMQVLPAMYELGDETWFDYTHLLFGAPGDDWTKPPVVAPGDASFWEGFVRSFDGRCASCHTSGYEPRAPGPDGVGPRSAWRALGVDCEACHGPGRAHADAWDRMETGDPLPRLRDLSRDALTGVCTQCHMEADLVEPEYRIGDDLYEYRDPTLLLDPERADSAGRPLELIYDGLPFASSHCAESGGLTCVDCHDPHGSHERSQLRHSPDEGGLCAGCHEEQVRDAEEHAHHDAHGTASRCVACHMPFLTIERGHGTVADHTIGVPRLEQAGDRVARDACRWCHEQARDAPLVSPALDEMALRDAYARWWPEARGPRPWMEALGAARAAHGDGHGDGASRNDAPEGLLAVVRDASNPRVVRASAARLLAGYADTHAAPILELTRDADSLVRRSAIAALAAVEGEEADARLLEALADPSLAVRGAAARSALAGWRRVRENTALRDAVTRILETEADRVPEDSRRWFRLGAIRGIAGDQRGALAAYERMLVLDPFANAVRSHVERLRRELRPTTPVPGTQERRR